MKEKIPFIALLLLSVFPLQTYGVITFSTVIFVFSVFFGSYRNWKELRRNRKADFYSMLFSFFFGAFLFLSLLYSNNFTKGVDFLIRLSPLYIVPIVVFFLDRKKINQKDIFYSKLAFILSTIIVTFYILLKSIYLQYVDGVLFFNNIKAIAKESLIWDLHPTYISLYCLMSIFLLSDFKVFTYKSEVVKTAIIAALIYLTVFCVLLSSRVAILCLLLGLLILVPKKRLKVLLFLFFCALIFLSIKFIEPVRNQFYDIYYSELSLPTEKYPSSIKVRYAIIHCSWESIKHNFFWGAGLGDFQSHLMDCYGTLGSNALLRHGYNSHNFYIFLWGSAGLFCVLSFILLVAQRLYLAYKSNAKRELLFWILILMVNLTESFLVRSYGITFFVYFFVIFYLSNRSDGFHNNPSI